MTAFRDPHINQKSFNQEILAPLSKKKSFTINKSPNKSLKNQSFSERILVVSLEVLDSENVRFV